MYGYDLRLNHVMGNHDIEIGYRHHRDYRDRKDSGLSEKFTLDQITLWLQMQLTQFTHQQVVVTMIMQAQNHIYYR